MTKYVVLVADGARARILSLEPAHDPRAAERLIERVDLVNPEHELRPHLRFEGGRSESHGHVAGHGYAMDDHRLRQDDEHERRFAGLAAGQAQRWASDLRATRLVVVAPAKMLGFIRSEGEDLFKLGLEVREKVSEVARLPLTGLQTYLEEQELLPASRASS